MKPYVKIIAFIFLAIVIIMIGKSLVRKYHRLAESMAVGELNEKLSELNVLHKCYDPKTLEEYISQEGYDYEVENKKVVLDSLSKLNMPLSPVKDGDQLKIPPITHHVYFSNPQKPIQLNNFYLELMKVNYERYNNSNSNWVHYIWTNMPELFPDEIKNIKGVQVKNLEEFSDHQLYNLLLSVIASGSELRGRYSEASDILRFMTLQKHGGFYSDMDYEIFHPEILLEYMKSYDFVGGRDLNGYYASQFMAAKPNHPIVNKAVELTYRNDITPEKAPDSFNYPCSIYNRIYFKAPPLVTTAYFAENNKDGNNDLLLPLWMAFNPIFAKYKNKTCEYSEVTVESFAETEKNLDKTMSDFVNDLSIKGYNPTDNPKDYQKNIYYSFDYRDKWKIIGVDMGCGTWAREGAGYKKIIYFNNISDWDFKSIFSWKFWTK